MTDYVMQPVSDLDPLLRRTRLEFARLQGNKIREQAKLQRVESQRRERQQRNELARQRAIDALVRSHRRALEEKFRGT